MGPMGMGGPVMMLVSKVLSNSIVILSSFYFYLLRSCVSQSYVANDLLRIFNL